MGRATFADNVNTVSCSPPHHTTPQGQQSEPYFSPRTFAKSGCDMTTARLAESQCIHSLHLSLISGAIYGAIFIELHLSLTQQ